VQVQDRLRVDFKLEVGQVTEQIEVSAQAQLVESESSTTGVVIDTQKIIELPSNGRDWLRLGRTAPGVVSTYRARDRSFTANGMRSIQNTFIIDGVVNVSYLRGLDDRRRDVVRPSVDSLQEFRVQTSQFSAEYGQSAGAVVNATIKSGANRPFGSLFEFARNSALDATPYFQPAGTKKPQLNQHQFGGSVGGPIWRDHTFFFAAYEGQRFLTASPQIGSVPTDTNRAGNFGAARIYDPATTRLNPAGAGYIRDPFADNIIPLSRFDPVARKLLALYPIANQPGTVRNFYYNPKRTDRSDQMDTRVDHRLNPANSVFGRFSFYNSPDSDPKTLPSPANPVVETSNNTRGLAASWIHSFGSAAVNEVRYGWNSILVDQSTGNKLDDYGVANSLAAGIPGPPVIAINGYTSLGAQGNVPIRKTSQSQQFLDNLTFTRGQHTLKVGVDVRLISAFTAATLSGKGTLTFNGVYSQNPQSRGNTGSAFADFLLGYTSSANVGAPIIADERGKVYAGYLQDDWKISRRLTVNVGLRYEVSTPYIELNNKLANFIYDPNASGFGGTVLAGKNGVSRGLLNTDLNNFGPRLGFALQANEKTVFRGGYGIFYGQDEGIGVSNRPAANPPFSVVVNYPSDQITPSITLQGGFPGDAIDPKNARFPSARAYPANFPLPYVQQWSFNVQRELPGKWVLEAGYVGSHGVKLQGGRDINQPLPGAGDVNSRRPFAGYGAIVAIEPYNRSKYNGLNLRAEHRFSEGFTVLGAYTWGHVLDIASSVGGEDDYSALPQDSRNLRAERADAAFDIRQRFSVSYIWELPFGKGKLLARSGLASTLFGGWEIAGLTELESGRPFNVTSNRDSSNTGTTARPNRLRSGELPASERSLNRWFDTSAFVIAPDFSFGNTSRNALRGPGRVNFDVGLHRNFILRERLKLQFRAELFNATNTPQFGDPNGNIGNPLAGVISSTITGPRQIQLCARFSF